MSKEKAKAKDARSDKRAKEPRESKALSEPGAAKVEKEPKESKERRYLARVFVSLKPTVNDPEGTTIAGALGSLGFEGLESVRAGRYFQVTLRAADEKKAKKQIGLMCDRLLANPVIETYRYEIGEA